MTLVDRIAAAFSVEPVPSEPLFEPQFLDPAKQGDDGATDYFLGKQWNTLEVAELRYHSDAMFMFTPEVHRYYLPAFMSASLTHPDEADTIPDDILFHLGHNDLFWNERVKALSAAQREVVASFLRAVADPKIDGSRLTAALEALSQAPQMPNTSLERTRER